MDRKSYHKQEPYDSWTERRGSKMPAPRKQPEQRKAPVLPEPKTLLGQVTALLQEKQALEPGTEQ